MASGQGNCSLNNMAGRNVRRGLPEDEGRVLRVNLDPPRIDEASGHPRRERRMTFMNPIQSGRPTERVLRLSIADLPERPVSSVPTTVTNIFSPALPAPNTLPEQPLSSTFTPERPASNTLTPAIECNHEVLCGSTPVVFDYHYWRQQERELAAKLAERIAAIQKAGNEARKAGRIAEREKKRPAKAAAEKAEREAAAAAKEAATRPQSPSSATSTTSEDPDIDKRPKFIRDIINRLRGNRAPNENVDTVVGQRPDFILKIMKKLK